MNKKLGKDDMADSQAAIRGYINFRESNGYRHKAHVLISSNGKERFNDILYISAIIDSGNSYVVVEGNNAFVREFYGKYSFEYQKCESRVEQELGKSGSNAAKDMTKQARQGADQGGGLDVR